MVSVSRVVADTDNLYSSGVTAPDTEITSPSCNSELEASTSVLRRNDVDDKWDYISLLKITDFNEIL